MGNYIQAKPGLTKAETLKALGAQEVFTIPASYSAIPPGKKLVVLVDNVFFDAAGVVESERDFDEFTSPNDPRSRRYFLLENKTTDASVSEYDWKKDAGFIGPIVRRTT